MALADPRPTLFRFLARCGRFGAGRSQTLFAGHSGTKEIDRPGGSLSKLRAPGSWPASAPQAPRTTPLSVVLLAASMRSKRGPPQDPGSPDGLTCPNEASTDTRYVGTS